MRYLGLIPARAGSARVTQKNVAICGGKALIVWTINAALESRRLNHTVISTNDSLVAYYAGRNNVPILWRPDFLCGPGIRTEDVIKHALEAFPDYDAVVLLQPTSPLRRASHIDAAIEQWTGEQPLVSVDPHDIENGAIYISYRQPILDGRRLYDEDERHFERFVMSERDSIDVDVPEDIARVERIMSLKK